MPTNRFEPSRIKNKLKREELAKKVKKAKGHAKLQKRLEQAKIESSDPSVKKKRLSENVPRTLDNTREFDPTFLTAEPTPSTSDPEPECNESSSAPQPTQESAEDIATDPFAGYFNARDPSVPPRVLITTSMKTSRLTFDFCEELASVIPGSDFIRRKKGKGFELGHIAVWAAGRGYDNLIVVNDDNKKPNAMTIVHLPVGPTAYFKLSSVQLTQQISGHARPTTHYPELVLNNFVTRLGHTVGRMFQTLFPPMPEFEGRQVVTLHNQRDFLFFRRHRYAFRSTEKAALQEIGPRVTLKLRWLKKGTPAVLSLGESARAMELFEQRDDEMQADDALCEGEDEAVPSESNKQFMPPTQDEYLWQWKPELETTRRTFFL